MGSPETPAPCFRLAKDAYGNTVGAGPKQYLGIVDPSGTDDRAEAGGEVTISGVTSEAGTDQSPGELEFIITKNATGITES